MDLDRSLQWKKIDAYDRFAGDGDDAVFDTYSDFILFAACLGYQKGEREEYDGTNAVRMSGILSDDLRKVMSRSLAYAETEDMEAIDDIDIQTEIVGEYALSGAKIADSEVDNTGELLEAVVEYLQDNRDEDEEERRKGILEEIEDHWE